MQCVPAATNGGAIIGSVVVIWPPTERLLAHVWAVEYTESRGSQGRANGPFCGGKIHDFGAVKGRKAAPSLLCPLTPPSGAGGERPHQGAGILVIYGWAARNIENNACRQAWLELILQTFSPTRLPEESPLGYHATCGEESPHPPRGYMEHTRLRFSSLSLADQRALFEDAAPSWTRIFGVPASDLEGYWFGKKSRETIVHVLRDDQGEVCGTFTCKYYEVVHRERRIVIVKLGVGILPEVRGSRFTLRCVVREALRHAIKYASDEVYFFSTLIHPVTYQMASRLFNRFYPYYDRAQDPELEELARFLADHFELRRAETEDPLIFQEARSTMETAEERAYWQRKSDPAVRFFLDRCPNYGHGECFIFLARLPLWILAPAIGNSVTTWFKRRLRRRRRR
jgi:hypothetical protein